MKLFPQFLFSTGRAPFESTIGIRRIFLSTHQAMREESIRNQSLLREITTGLPLSALRADPALCIGKRSALLALRSSFVLGMGAVMKLLPQFLFSAGRAPFASSIIVRGVLAGTRQTIRSKHACGQILFGEITGMFHLSALRAGLAVPASERFTLFTARNTTILILLAPIKILQRLILPTKRTLLHRSALTLVTGTTMKNEAGCINQKILHRLMLSTPGA